MYTIYVLQSLKDHGFYIGQTSDLHRRIQEHHDGISRSTKNRRPLILVYQEKFASRGEAMKREKMLKKQKGGDVFKKIIDGGS